MFRGPDRRLVLDHVAVATVDGADRVIRDGHVVVEDDRIVAVGTGRAPAPALADSRPTRHIDGTGCLLTPGLVNAHHHLAQWLTRGRRTQSPLMDWLAALYPAWTGIDEPAMGTAARAALAVLLRSGCTTTADHHYLFPPGGGDLLAAEIRAAGEVGVRFHPVRGSMDLGASDGGLPPDEAVEDTDTALAATEDAIQRFHDPSYGSMLLVGVGPCAPFTVTERLLRESARIARRHGVRMHTHVSETREEEAYCQERFGTTPVGYLDRLGWLGSDVWLAHGVHLDSPAIDRIAATGTAVAHCPSSNARLGSGLAPIPDLLRSGVPVGLGVDGGSNEAGRLDAELRTALQFARVAGGADALTPARALRMATMDGARCLGREGAIGSVEVGKLADLALWRLDGLGHAGIEDPVAALVLAGAAPLRLVCVGGQPVVEDGAVLTVDSDALAAEVRAAEVRAAEERGDPQTIR